LFIVGSKLATARSLVSMALSVGLLFPLASAYAESFTVTTNKDLYTVGEKAIIVGIIPDTAPEGYAVLLRVTGPDGSECVVQNLLPNSDYSFVSRPLDLGECGSGEYAVTAYYADISTNSSFTVTNSTQSGSGNKLELRLLKNVAMQAQESVNERMREFLESNQVLPEDIADMYSLGVFEASQVVQAVDFGNAAEAKKHLIFTIKHFRGVLDSLSAERIIFEVDLEVDASSDDDREVMLDRYERLKEFYFRLEEISQKNGIDNENEFGIIVSVLARSKQLIDDGHLESARGDLQDADERLELVRQNLFSSSRSAASEANSTLDEDLQARRLTNAADRFERNAHSLLEGNPSEAVNATIQEALQLISLARIDIENGEYSFARSNLSAAFSALDEAKEMMKDEQAESGNSGHEDNDSSGNGKAEDGKGKNGDSGKESDEDDH
jgi:hypothetical protein